MSLKQCKGNAWNMQTCNRLVNERLESRRHRKHIDALDYVEAATDHSAPMEHSHLKDKSKARRMQEDRDAEIQLENRILLQKMLNIDTKPSQFSAENFSARSAPTRPSSTLHGVKHRRELDRITNENQNLLHRLQHCKPSIDVQRWEDDEMDRQALKYRLSQNACRARGLKLPMPSARNMAHTDYTPRLGSQSARFHDDGWARLTNSELDQKLLALESGAPFS